MNKLIYKSFIEDCVKDKCTTVQQEVLVAIYDVAVRQVAATSAHKAWFEARDFEGSTEGDVEGFTFTIEKRKLDDGKTQWIGAFRNGDKNLRVSASEE